MKPLLQDSLPVGFRKRSYLYLIFTTIIVVYYLSAILVGLTPRRQLMATWQGPFHLTCAMAVGYTVFQVFRSLLEMPPTYGELGLRLRERCWGWEASERIIGFFVLGLGVNLMFDVFAAYKPAIPQFRPYTWDLWLANLDRVLHLGRDPWEWLHALPARDLLTAYLDWAYLQWYRVVALVVLGVLSIAPLEPRIRFFMGYALLWIMAGSLLAILFASGGPVYFGEFLGDSPRFQLLFDYLDGAAPTARRLQDALWRAFQGPAGALPFEGIAAMPSLHVGVAVYFMFWAWGGSRWLGILSLLYAVTIMVGSVHLGWHYAIDGYVGALVAFGCWWISTRIRFTTGQA